MSTTAAVRAASAWEVLRTKPSWRFTLLILTIGMGLFSGAITDTVTNGLDFPLVALVAVPLIALIARFPIVIEERDAAVEIGFESAVLMLLLCTLPPPVAHLVWSLGVLLTQAISGKRLSAWTFNVGAGILAGALATGIFDLTRGPGAATPRELVAVLLAATAYFLTDYLLTGVSLALDSGTSVRAHLVGGGSWLAICCFVPFDMLGYLGAILLRSTPSWSLVLLAVPLVTLLIATRAVTRGRENARRLQVLLDAAVDSQTLSEPQQVVDALVSDARRLLGMQDLDVRSSAPRATEIGAYVRGREDPLWIVAPARSRARSTTTADQQALSALAAVSSAAFARLELTEDLVHLARYDPLTDLPNRAVFLDRLHYSLHQARRRGKSLALLFVDLDGFKPINDRFGHAAGDAVLIDVAKRLRASVRDDDTVARLGGDEFAVLFEDIELQEVTAACRRILSTLSGGVDADDHTVNVGASIGIVHGAGEESADDMLRNADLAMYEAKARGKDQYVVYQPRMLTSRLDRLELVEALEHALDTGALTLAYQPVIVAATGHISGVEALCRWRHEGVDMRPDIFIAVAEETGLIATLGAVVLDTVARDAAAIRRAAGSPISVAVNVSPTQLTRPEFVDIVEETVGRMAGLSLTLEITEREGISHDAGVLTHMQTISEMGVGFAIDDFGVGFSSISYLQEVPARIVKVDATLSRDIDHDPKARGLLRSITMMSQALGLDVVVEGVERESQLALVRQDVPGAYAQGYFMHRPMPLAQLLEVLAANRDETMSRLLAIPPSRL